MVKLICTLTFEDEGDALQAAIKLKAPVHSRGGRMKLDENAIRSRHHDVLIYALANEQAPALDDWCRSHDWAHYDGLRDLEPAEL
jgi:hypothetical protein